MIVHNKSHFPINTFQKSKSEFCLYLNTFDIFYKHQYGFRPKHSTLHPIIHLLNKIAENNDKTTKELTLAVFIDLSKAFDTISHDILLNKLENLGIRGIANKWFASYLSERKQYMELLNIKSRSEIIKCGVPQGSILGPLLFDISNSTIKLKTIIVYR